MSISNDLLDSQFRSLLGSLSPMEKHRLLNITRQELGIDISEGVGISKLDMFFSTDDRKTQVKEMKAEAKLLRAKAREITKTIKEIV